MREEVSPFATRYSYVTLLHACASLFLFQKAQSGTINTDVGFSCYQTVFPLSEVMENALMC